MKAPSIDTWSLKQGKALAWSRSERESFKGRHWGKVSALWKIMTLTCVRLDSSAPQDSSFRCLEHFRCRRCSRHKDSLRTEQSNQGELWIKYHQLDITIGADSGSVSVIGIKIYASMFCVQKSWHHESLNEIIVDC